VIVRSHRSGNELFPNPAWRYLLPDPTPRSVVAIGTGPAADHARLLGDSRPAGHGTADLAVADRSDSATIAELVRSVRPGGVVCVDVAWPRLRPVRTLERRLAAAGLAPSTVYSLSPSRDRWSPSWWIPVGRSDAAVFVATAAAGLPPSGDRPLAHRLRARVQVWLLAWLGSRPALIGGAPWLLHPARRQRLLAVAVKATGAVAARSMPGLSPVDGLPSGGGGPGRDIAVAMRVGGSSTDQAMLFVFGAGPTPGVVIKAPTEPEEVVASRQEHETLTALTSGAEPMPGVPRPVALTGGDGVPAWGQTFAPGRALTATLDPDELAVPAEAVTTWLIGLADRTATAADPDRVHELVWGAVDELTATLRSVPDGTWLEQQVRQRLRGLALPRLVAHHRDLGPWNIRADGDDLSIIDWADAVPQGPPVCDLLHYLAHLTLCAHDAYGTRRQGELVDSLPQPESPAGALVEACLDRYCRAVGIDRCALPGLRVLTWVLDLLRRPPAERAGGLYLDLLRAEVRFGGTSAPHCGSRLERPRGNDPQGHPIGADDVRHRRTRTDRPPDGRLM
jgi:hypothetical protein